MNSDNGQTPRVELSPQAVIDALVERVQQLSVENVMLQAAISQLRQAPGRDQVPEQDQARDQVENQGKV